VLSNDDGGNLRAGITQALARGARTGYAVGVLEVDERALATLAGTLAPEVVVLLNLTRDQLDRTGEVRFHVAGWERALREAPGALVVANADDPLVVAAVLGGRPDGAGVRWVGAGQPWHRDCPLCPRCGAPWASWTDAFRCARCGLARPASSVEVGSGHRLVLDGRAYDPRLGLPGRANVANAAMAAAAAECLGVPVLLSLEAMRSVTVVAGRYLQADHAGSRVQLLLAKNPAGWAEVLDQLAGTTGPVVVAVNNRPADGADTSWLWDVPFEQLVGRPVVAAGEQAAAVSLRLRYADVPHTVVADPLGAVAALGAASAVVVANYTAFRAVHRRLERGTAAGPRAA
jgi:UDP-N-acetylmuramyl tripeptide synthase